MKFKLKWWSCVPMAVAMLIVFLSTASVSQAQPETPKQRLRSPATVRSSIGGEAQDHYVIRARKGQTMTVTFTWRKEGDNDAYIYVTPDSEGAESLTGTESN